jgi:hypothetical protein
MDGFPRSHVQFPFGVVRRSAPRALRFVIRASFDVNDRAKELIVIHFRSPRSGGQIPPMVSETVKRHVTTLTREPVPYLLIYTTCAIFSRNNLAFRVLGNT